MNGTNLTTIYLNHQQRLQSRPKVRKGGEALLTLPYESVTELGQGGGGGLNLPIFVPGVHDPDDTSVTRWIP
jgi:hypothetical protein